ncbi:hypothetical protein LTR85_011109 [Meristemomyces frigidus]|nr:hypothetical protein LTR85_011109 [Meristemomyces frigidus]
MAAKTAVQVISIAIAFIGSGGIASLSLFDVPELQSQPADRALPSLRYLFSRGSHIFPQAAMISSVGFVYLAYASLPVAQRSAVELLKLAVSGGKVSGYLAAAALTFGIAPWTMLVMVPTNFKLIQMNEDLGGARSAASVEKGDAKPGQKTAEESAFSKGAAGEFGDLSGPQGRTAQRSSGEDDRKVRELLARFGRLNGLRAVLMGAGGVVGLWVALAL